MCPDLHTRLGWTLNPMTSVIIKRRGHTEAQRGERHVERTDFLAQRRWEASEEASRWETVEFTWKSLDGGMGAGHQP